MSSYQNARTPAFASDLSRNIVQLHSLHYRNPSQLKQGDVLIAGAGNSGSELAGGPLIRVKPRDLQTAGVTRVAKVTGTHGGLPQLADGTTLNVANILWCTGFRTDFSWIDLPVFDQTGEPLHQGGVVTSEPGLYYVGLHFLYSMSSTMIHGVGRDAERIVTTIAERIRERGKRARVQ